MTTTMLIASPFLGNYLLVRPGYAQGVRVSRDRYLELVSAPARPCPDWLTGAAERSWGIDLRGQRVDRAVLVRPETALGYGRASYEINLGCNYDCEHCYLGLKKFEGLDWPGKKRLLHMLRDAGVLWLQITGGEPLVDRLFPQTYQLAAELGMLLHISTNGSRLHHPPIRDLLAAHRPYRVTVSVYGATEAAYDGLTRRRGSYRAFRKGLDAAAADGLPVKLTIVLTRTNAHEEQAMINLADEYGVPYLVYSNLSPTIYGGAEVLPAQSVEHLRERRPFTGCNAGHTFFHVDPHGKASICKVGRDPSVDLMAEGIEGLRRLGRISDSLMLRTGGCSGCQLSGSCTVCRPLAKLYQEAKAPLYAYCQHGREGR